jgi:hypothetical protein
VIGEVDPRHAVFVERGLSHGDRALPDPANATCR